jgi:membrane protein implicated in regulation of membrane protease activity
VSSEPRKNLGLGALALIPLTCCIGLPLIVAAVTGAGLAAWTGGLTLGALAPLAVAAALILRARRRRPGRPPALVDRRRT